MRRNRTTSRTTITSGLISRLMKENTPRTTINPKAAPR